jgi:hypothetical protein
MTSVRFDFEFQGTSVRGKPRHVRVFSSNEICPSRARSFEVFFSIAADDRLPTGNGRRSGRNAPKSAPLFSRFDGSVAADRLSVFPRQLVRFGEPR